MSIGESCISVLLAIEKKRLRLEHHRDAIASAVPGSGQSKQRTFHGNGRATILAGLHALNQRLIAAPR